MRSAQHAIHAKLEEEGRARPGPNRLRIGAVPAVGFRVVSRVERALRRCSGLLVPRYRADSRLQPG